MKIYNAEIQYTAVAEGTTEVLGTAEQFTKYMQGAFDRHPLQESLWVVLMDAKARPIARHMVSLGTVDAALVGIQEVFRPAILAGSRKLVLVHNHPSGDPSPSRADMEVTRKIKAAGNVLEIRLEDHVIVGDPAQDPQGLGYFSFLESHMLPN